MSPRSREMLLCRLLEEDPDLLEAVPVHLRSRAVDECIAPIAHLRRGSWDARDPELAHAGIGLLVLDGLLIRRVGIDGRFGAELLGEGDLLRPWHGQDAPPSLPQTTGWRVLETTRLALLDERVAHRLARYPALTGGLVGRALERSRNLTVNIAIVHQPRVDIRLMMLFWHLAARWGHVRTDGVFVPMHLTRTVLADLVAARRPTVSTSLTELARSGSIVPLPGGWLLTGDPPGELLELRTGDGAIPSAPGLPAGQHPE
jgi:hypothetical protein